MSLLHAGMCSSLTLEVFESLKLAGVKTVLNFISSDVEELSQKCSVAYKVLLSIRRLLLAQHAAFPLNGTNMYEEVLSTAACLTTGCDSMDKLLDDGVYTSELTEIVGSPASGKTQFCLTLAASVASSLEQNVLYIDTSGGFDPARLRQILSKRSKEEKLISASLTRVQCAKTFDVYDLLDFVDMVKASINSGTDPFYTGLKLVVVDSVTSVLAPLLGGKQSEGQGMMMHLARCLKALAADYAIAVVICNNMVRGERGDPKPALGRSWLSVPQTRILLRADGRDEITSLTRDATIHRTAWLVKSQRLAVNASCSINIGEEGVYG